jgi:hypothetical protein
MLQLTVQSFPVALILILSNSLSFAQTNACTGSITTPGQQCTVNPAVTAVVLQAKPVIDVRDYSVTCNGSTDDTSAMNRAIAAACPTAAIGGHLILPHSCRIKISSTLSFKECIGITMDGGNSQGQATMSPGGNAVFIWAGASGGTVLEVNQTRDSTFENFAVDAGSANIGLLIDEVSPITHIVTNNQYENLAIYNGSANSSWIGVEICPTAPGNCEAQNFHRLTINCAGGTPTSTSNGIGIQYGPGGEPFYEYIHWYESTGCSQAISLQDGNVFDIDGGLASGNYTDLFVNAGRNISYRHIRTEGAIAQIVLGTSSSSGAHDLTVEENSFSGLTNNTTTISYPFFDTGGVIRLIKNDWDANSTVTPFGPTGSGIFVGTLESASNNYPNSSLCIQSAFANSGEVYVSLNDGPPNGTCNYAGLLVGSSHGVIQTTRTVFSVLPSCASGTAGTQKAISDSTTNTWGATITGGGSNSVLAFCDGTNWTVAAK